MNDPRRVEAALARNLREWRAKRGWCQAELATRFVQYLRSEPAQALLAAAGFSLP